jgi:hypothetical protein
MDKRYFYGNEISKYGIENNRVDYGTLAKCFDAVLCNDIRKLFYSTINGDYMEPELVNGPDYNEEDDDYYYDIYQYYIIDKTGYRLLTELTNEIVYYIEELDIAIWGVTHFGTSWDYVLTNIKIDKKGE